MTQDTISILQFWFLWGWRLLTSTYLPGTNVTPAAMLLFGAFAILSIKFFTNLMGVGGAGSVIPRSSSAKNKK